MNRDELKQLIEMASLIANDTNVVVIGSQSILGSYDEQDLPAAATMSMEADLTFFDDVDNRKSDSVDLSLGEGSAFDVARGYYGQGVEIATAVLPVGWRDRLVRLRGTTGVAWCLEPHDLALSKLVAGREKDHEFVFALLEAELLDHAVLAERLHLLPITGLQKRRISSWLEAAGRKFR